MNLPNDIFQGLHILLISEDEARGKALTKALRDHNGRLADLKPGARDPAAVRGVDLAVVDARSQLNSAAQLTELQADARARWASVVTVDYERLVKGDGSVLLGTLTDLVAPLVEADRRLTARAREESSFATTLAPLGPSRTLRALSLSGHTLFVELRHPTLDALIEVSNDLLVSASASRGGKRWDAWSALVRILGLKDAEVLVSRRAFTSVMNIMEPVDQALEVAAQERLCSADQIAVEEAEAQTRSTASHELPPREVPARGYAPPQPPAGRPMAAVSAQRTLLGIKPGLPALNLVPPPSPAPMAQAPGKPVEAPRYAHRPGQLQGPKASMTLLGVAPGAIPGLAELRAQAELETRSPANQQNASRFAEPSGAGAAQRATDSSDFDPPTGRHSSLPDLSDELPDLLDDLSLSAHPLSSPLPPVFARAPEGALRPPEELNNAQQESLTTPAPAELEDTEDPLDQTSITPSHMTKALLARAFEEEANTERPPPHVEPSAAESGPAVEATPEPDQAETSDDDTVVEGRNETPIGEETLVVLRPRETPRSRLGMLVAGALLLGLLAVLFQLSMRTPEQPAAAAPPASARTTEGALRPAPSPAPSAAESPEARGSALEQDKALPPATQENAAPPQPVSSAGEVASAALASPPAASEPARTAPSPSAPVTSRAPEDALRPPAPSQPAQGASATPPVAPPPAPAAADRAEPASPLPSAPAQASAQPKSPGDTAAADAVDEASAAASAADVVKRAQRFLAQRNAPLARPLFEQALATAPENPHVRAGLAETLLKLGDAQAALPQAQAACKLRPKRGRYQVLLGDVWAALAKPDDAKAAWQKALELDPEDAEAQRRLAP